MIKKNAKYGVVKVKSGTVILNDIIYDEQNNTLNFDYIVKEDVSEETKIQIEKELKEFFDKDIKENFLNYFNSKVTK
jgi:hypothetical protein